MRNSGGERELFEVAHVYRAVYALRTAYDRKSVLTVSERMRMPADPTVSASERFLNRTMAVRLARATAMRGKPSCRHQARVLRDP